MNRIEFHQIGPSSLEPVAVTGAAWCDELARSRQPGPTLGGATLGTPATQCVHAGTVQDARTGAVGTPIFQCTTFKLDDSRYRSIDLGYGRDRLIYTRYGNPTQWAVQGKIAALEGAESSCAFSSGMAAISTTLLALLDPGGHVVTSFDVYGGSYDFLDHELPNLGMSATFVDARDYDAIEAAIRPETQVLFFELVTNPLLKVADVERLSDIARRHGLRLVIDATFASPLGCRPLELGADVVVHSASKYLNGHADLIAGVASGSRKLIDRVWGRLLAFGGCLDPHACFLLERGLKTLAVRMRAHEENATAVARFLEVHPRVTRVLYPGLQSHPDFGVARRLLKRAGGMVTFVIDGGDEAARAFASRLSLIQEATSLGGVESLVSLPFNTSHAALTAGRRRRIGIESGCIRLSVGIEDPEDLIEDLTEALAQ